MYALSNVWQSFSSFIEWKAQHALNSWRSIPLAFQLSIYGFCGSIVTSSPPPQRSLELLPSRGNFSVILELDNEWVLVHTFRTLFLIHHGVSKQKMSEDYVYGIRWQAPSSFHPDTISHRFWPNPTTDPSPGGGGSQPLPAQLVTQMNISLVNCDNIISNKLVSVIFILLIKR